MATEQAGRTRKRTARTIALAAALLFQGLSGLVGVGLIVWIAVEVVIIGYQPEPPLQLIYEGVGLLILLLTLKPLEGGAVR